MTTVAAQASPGRSYAIFSLVLAGFVLILTRDTLFAAAIVVLGVVWYILRTRDEPPVLALALTFQWTQVTIGLIYFYVTGRVVEAIYRSNYRPMVAIGLACVLMLAIGIALGRYFTSKWLRDREPLMQELPFNWNVLIAAYIAAFFVEVGLREIAFSFPGLTQGLIAISFARLGLLFLIVRRLCRPHVRWLPLLALLVIEISIGLTGFFAGFREPLIMVCIALAELFDARRATHWLSLALTLVLGSVVGIGWLTVRGAYREEIAAEQLQTRAQRLSRMLDLSQQLRDMDAYSRMIAVDLFVERMWPIYYPALAIERVPGVIPHRNGELTLAGVLHALQPRILFPNKPNLTSDSDRVREYSGVYVAGVEQDTSIAFGYAAEAYVDFGVPWMFAPIFAWGICMGIAYNFFASRLRCREFGQAVLCVMFWMSLYLFERAWAKTVGLSGTLFIYVGLIALIADRFIVRTFTPIYESNLPLLNDRSPRPSPANPPTPPGR